MKHQETAKRLAYAMSLRNIKAAELARRAGVSKASVSQYINGSHSPGNINAGKIGEVLGVSPVWLMGFNVSMIEESDKDEGREVLYELFNGLDVDKKAALLSYARYLSKKED